MTTSTHPDTTAAERFVLTHGRLLDRLRLQHLLHGGAREACLRALAAYRTDDGGIGHALEPDIRTATAQPVHVLTALELLEELDAAGDPLVRDACDWLDRTADADGGVPFVLPSAFGAPLAPWWTPTDDPPPSLHMTSALVAPLLRMGVEHPFVERASAFCWARMPELDLGAGYEVKYAVAFLDAAPDRERAEAELARLRDAIGGRPVPVSGGTSTEVIRPIDLAPRPGRPARALFDDATIEEDLDRLAGAQREDGGWDFTWLAWDDGVAVEWRGRLTVDALHTLRANGRLSLP